MKTEPALTIGALITVLSEILTAVTQVQVAGQPFNWWLALTAALPLVGAALIRFQVIPVGAVEEALEKATTVEQVLREILSRLSDAKRQELRRLRRAKHGTADPIP
jgi:hypothetical protein